MDYEYSLALAQLLPSVTHIEMHKCDMRYAASCIGTSLRRIDNLLEVDLTDNNLTDEGAKWML